MRIQVRDATQGVRVKDDSAFPRSFCECWLTAMEEYRRALPEDWWPFWYGERPLVGFLAAGIWSSKGVCIEEFISEKKAGSATAPKPPYDGRTDLYFNRGGREGNIEFKMHTLGVSRSRDFSKQLRALWKETKDDAGAGKQRNIASLGGMFLRPYAGKNRKDAGRLEANVKNLIETAWNVIKPDAIAWWCPIEAVLPTDKVSDYISVGVILVVKKV